MYCLSVDSFWFARMLFVFCRFDCAVPFVGYYFDSLCLYVCLPSLFVCLFAVLFLCCLVCLLVSVLC